MSQSSFLSRSLSSVDMYCWTSRGLCSECHQFHGTCKGMTIPAMWYFPWQQKMAGICYFRSYLLNCKDSNIIIPWKDQPLEVTLHSKGPVFTLFWKNWVPDWIQQFAVYVVPGESPLCMFLNITGTWLKDCCNYWNSNALDKLAIKI